LTLLFKGQSSNRPTTIVQIDLFDVSIAKLVAGTENCVDGSNCLPPVESLFLKFNKITVSHGGSQDTVTFDLATGLSPNNVGSGDLNEALNVNMGNAGSANLERANSFTGPTQTPGGLLVEAAFNPEERNAEDPGVDRRPTRFLALVKNLVVPSGHVHANASKTAQGTRTYDMTGIRFTTISYSGLVEKLAFSVQSMTWTIGNEQASFP